MARLFARSMHNTRAYASAPVNVGHNVSVVAAIRLGEGVTASMTTEGSFDGDLFLLYVKEVLAPTLRPGDYVLMDNLGVHKGAAITQAIEAAGAHVLWLPSYSPEFDPVEKLWSTFKGWIRGQAARTKETLDAAIAQSLSRITPEQVHGWFKVSGYATAKVKPL